MKRAAPWDFWLYGSSGHMESSGHRLVGTAARLCDGKDWLVFTTGVVPAISSGVREADDGWRKCAGSDTGLHNIFLILSETMAGTSSRTGCSMMERAGLTGGT